MITAPELVLFLEHEQDMKVDVERARHMIAQYETSNSTDGNRLSITGFTNMMTCRQLFNIQLPEHTRVNQDMSQPLNQYYIASSHNT